jgi:leucyl-tRNA synthetase
LFATLAGEISFTDLTPASGRQDHTTSPSADQRLRQCAISVHRIPPRVRDDREPPLQWDETAKHMQVIWVGREREYFCKEDWTGKSLFSIFVMARHDASVFYLRHSGMRLLALARNP